MALENVDQVEFGCSLRQLSRIFDIDRDSIKSRLTAEPAGKRNGHNIYKISDVSKFTGGKKSTDGLADLDPDSLELDELTTYWRGQDLKESSRIKQRRNSTEERQLLNASDVEMANAKLFKILSTFIDTLPDVLEMQCNLKPDVVEVLIEETEQTKNNLYKQLMNLSDDLKNNQQEL
ncbi:MAG: DUF1441 family protein [Methylococcaceae bacterium]